MSARNAAWMGTVWDVGLTAFQLCHAILIGYFVDAAGNGESLKKGVAIYLPCIHFAIACFLLWQNYVKVGTKGAARKNPETLLGLWCEVINVVLAFGCLFNCARVWALPSTDPFNSNPFLHNLADSVYESSMVQFGVGYVAAAPTTLLERLVTFLTAYVGGKNDTISLLEHSTMKTQHRVHSFSFKFSLFCRNALCQHVLAERAVWETLLGGGPGRT
jgi:hypothetical protein